MQLVQVVGTEAPTVEEYVPASHATQELSAVAPVLVRYLPATHSMQMLAEEAPSVVEYLPAAQPVHKSLPISVLYVPAKHAEQTPPSDPVYPLLQRQWVAATLPLGELECSGHAAQVVAEAAPTAAEYASAAQSVHAAEPEPALYFPAIHSTQTSPLDTAVVPASQVQSVRRADAGGEFEFTGQSSQVELPSADHPPAEHGWHVSTPVAPTAAE
jgi:hypothetical protein